MSMFEDIWLEGIEKDTGIKATGYQNLVDQIKLLKLKTRPTLGLDFGGVISLARTTDDIMPGILEVMSKLKGLFQNRIYIISRVDTDESEQRVRKYLYDHNLDIQLNISQERVYFCYKRHEKAPIAEKLGITHFVDDHTEVLSYMTSVPYKFSLMTRDEELIAYPPEKFGIVSCRRWSQISQAISKTFE